MMKSRHRPNLDHLRFSKPKQQQAYTKNFIVPRYDICYTVTNYIYNIQATITPATPPNALTLGDAHT